MRFYKAFATSICALLFFIAQSKGQSEVLYNGEVKLIGKDIELLTDSDSSIGLSEAVSSKSFVKSEKQFPNLSISSNSYWIRFKIRDADLKSLSIILLQPTIDHVEFFQLDSQNRIIQSNISGTRLPYAARLIDNQSYVYNIKQDGEEVANFYLKVHSGKQLILPIYIGTRDQIQKITISRDMLFGVYVGIIVTMLLYNLFIYSTVQDKNYLYYVVYLFFVLLTQASLEGYLFRFVTPDYPLLSDALIYIASAFLGLSALEFAKNFLASKRLMPRLHKWSYVFWGIYGLTIILYFTGNSNASYLLILIAAMLSAFFVLFLAIKVVLLGSRSARFFLFAWSLFILCVVIYVLKDLNILPYNMFTNSALLLGSSLEALLISFALADKINVYKKEKEESQEATLNALKENERIVLEQNIVLERKVIERTEELVETNHALSKTLEDLKEAQSQLVDSEKMAGLGQLTAGIAHEINNPINFVTSNIKPLELDILDLDTVIKMYEDLDPEQELKPQIANIESFKKQIDIVFVREEIKSLLSGIGEGARRTAEIIRSLKNFSRLDENDTKPVDLNEGISSTLVLVKNTFPDQMQVIREFGNLPLVECLPGKINQVFMNLITNAVHAIKSKEPKDDKGLLTIKTWEEGSDVKISIKDSGTGMPDEVKQKIFEPFFTTKDVGEGTGLGLSIVFRIIENHGGNIDVITKLNQGTEFIITLPINSK